MHLRVFVAQRTSLSLYSKERQRKLSKKEPFDDTEF
jgi:hypothetical protein